uniref:F-box domain-containing protein n=1 Tax=Phlebotomus papatasi TaxID=29031 RepID=A0A1B0DJM4_PHLPP
MIFIADIKTNVRSVLFSIAKSCKNLTFLNITDCFDVDDEAVLSIVNGCPKIDCIIFNKYDEPNWKQSFSLISQNTWDLLERKNIDIK